MKDTSPNNRMHLTAPLGAARFTLGKAPPRARFARTGAAGEAGGVLCRRCARRDSLRGA